MATLIMQLEYDGSAYSGWQIQDNAKSVQGALENALEVVCRQKILAVGAGRTDTGVHAAGQVATVVNFDCDIPRVKLKDAINRYLPFDIRLKNYWIVDEDFSARFDAIQREYVYNLNLNGSVFKRQFSGFVKYSLDIEQMVDSADIFVGEHNFTTFSKVNLSTKSYICDVLYSKWTQIDEWNYQYKVVANRFVYGMVRSLVGAMIDVGRKRKTKEQLQAGLLAEDRMLNSPFAPANGLILNKVYYREKYNFLNK